MITGYIEIEETFCGRMGVRTDGRTDIWDPLY